MSLSDIVRKVLISSECIRPIPVSKTLGFNVIRVSTIHKKYFSEKNDQKTICWNCGSIHHKDNCLFCEKCNVIQNPTQTKNYFNVFNLNETFDIDKNALRDKYRELQSELHPDKFTNRSQKEQEISAEFSSLVNHAYNVLQIPLKRAEYLLELKNENVEEQYALDDPEFLLEMMELNEELESITDTEKLKELNIRNQKKIQSITQKIGDCFVKNNFKEAKYFLVKLKYYSSLGNRINNVLRESGIVE